MRTDLSNGIEELLALLDVQRALGKTPAEDGACEDQAALMLAGNTDVRMEKVTAVRAALMSDEYCVPARAVAAKMLDTMLTIAGERALRERRKRRRVGHRTLIRAQRASVQ